MKKPPTLQQKYVLEHVQSHAEHVSKDAEKQKKDQLEIGCTKIQFWGREVKVIEWAEKWKMVVVEVDSEISRYEWPFKCWEPFVNLKITEDCGYLHRWATGDDYLVDGRRYGVKGDVVWAGGKRYLSSKERADFGSFAKFLAGKEFFSKKSII